MKSERMLFPFAVASFFAKNRDPLFRMML